MPTDKQKQIMEAVADMATRTRNTRDRMESDYNLYTLAPFEMKTGYKAYTSNDPMTFGDKVISWMSQSVRHLRIPSGQELEEQQKVNDLKEHFLIGLLKSADERLIDLLLPTLQDQLSFYIPLRGWYVGRALLVKSEDPEKGTYVDITPFDPLHTYWDIDRHGLWVCQRLKRTPKEIEAEYGIDLPKDMGTDPVEIYDYYDSKMNTVFTARETLKKETPHGSPKTPIFIGAVGARPPLQRFQPGEGDESVDQNKYADADYGQSIFRAGRDVNDTDNLMKSIMLNLVVRALKPGTKFTSRFGDKGLEDDPHAEGANIQLAENEKFELLELQKMSQDTPQFMNAVLSEKQRAFLPMSAYGSVPFQLSGYAINSLRQDIETVVQPCLVAIGHAHRQILQLITDQYMTGAFEPLSLSGYDRNRHYFRGIIRPEDIMDGGEPEVKFLARLPQDDAGKMQQAAIARDGPVPMLPDEYIWDEILGIQDVSAIRDQVNHQISQRMLPEAQLLTLMESALNRGDEKLFKIYMAELQFIINAKMMQRAGIVGQGGQNGQAPEVAAPGFSPQVLPNAAQGQSTPVPTPQGGPLVPPGTPRPGAQNGTFP